MTVSGGFAVVQRHSHLSQLQLRCLLTCPSSWHVHIVLSPIRRAKDCQLGLEQPFTAMNYKLLIILLTFNLFYLTLFHTGECFPFLRREKHRRNEVVLLQRPDKLARQMPISTLFSGPLALATFLFALPLLPSLVMAPLALAGIPPALNVLSNFLSSFTNGRPLNSILSTVLSDPLHTSASSSEPSTSSGKSL